MLELTAPGPVEDAIRKQAADIGIPITQYIAPFLKLVADGKSTLTAQLAPMLATTAK